MPAPALSVAAVRTALVKLFTLLGEKDRDRTTVLLPLADGDGRIPLDRALDALYHGVDRESALAAFRQFRMRLAFAAGQAAIRLSLDVDSRKRSTPDQRVCWFSGDDAAEQEIDRYTRHESVLTMAARPISQEAIVPAEVRHGRPFVSYFVLYAREDHALEEDLIAGLAERLEAVSEFEFDARFARELDAEAPWDEQIQRALTGCHFGLLLVSPALLKRWSGPSKPLHPLIATPGPIGWRRAIPVGLVPVPLDGSIDLKGLAPTQIFRGSTERFYAEFPAFDGSGSFVDDLSQAIVDVARRHLLPTNGALTRYVPPWNRGPRRRFAFEAYPTFNPIERARLVPSFGILTGLDKLVPSVGDAGERCDALEFLAVWACDADAPPFCAVLGEYGIGKTTNCKLLTQRLLDERDQGRHAPLPIFLDLRNLGDLAKQGPDLQTILDAIARKSWRQAPDVAPIDSREICRLVAEEGALAIFDGLDEVLVHLSPSAGQQLTRQLWRVLPAAREGPSLRSRRQRGKLLVSCRTHYFRTLREQKTHFTGEDRDGVSASDYRAIVLLPFRSEQIEHFLRVNLPEKDTKRLTELVASLHNLKELASRPYLLSLLTEQIPSLERSQMEGVAVTSAALYKQFIESWLDRDKGKHLITPQHKKRLMEYLAVALWRSGRLVWNIDDVDQWLIEFLEGSSKINAHYQAADPEILKEDLRTATFLVREREADFRFAHTSLHEFFLASFLHRALKDGRPDDWDMPVPGPETLDFLGELVAGDAEDACVATLRRIRDAYHPGRSELALAYALRARKRRLPAQSLAGSRLEGATLRGWRFEGDGTEAPLSLEETTFHDADLRGAIFRHVVLDRADFSRARLTNAEFRDSTAWNARWTETDLTGTLFRHATLLGADVRKATFHRTQWLRCKLPNVYDREFSRGSLFATCDAAAVSTPSESTNVTLQVLVGHTAGVKALRLVPKWHLLVSMGDDGAVYKWDQKTGDCLGIAELAPDVTAEALSWDGTRAACRRDGGAIDGRRCTIHLWDIVRDKRLTTLDLPTSSPFSGCEFSHDGRRLATFGARGVQVWNLATGALIHDIPSDAGSVRSCAFSWDDSMLAIVVEYGAIAVWRVGMSLELVRTLGPHPWVQTCVFSPDGAAIASGGLEKGPRLWNLLREDMPPEILDHRGPYVQGLSYSPDSRTLATAGDDSGTVLWDVVRKERLLTLAGHHHDTVVSGFSEDGSRVATADESGLLRVWHVKTGEPLMTARGHDLAVPMCAFAPNGQFVATVSRDGAVRLWDPSTTPPGKGRDEPVPEGPMLIATLGTPNGGMRIHDCKFSPSNANFLATAGDDGTVLWSVRDAARVRTFGSDATKTDMVAFSPDGRLLAAAAVARRTIDLWDIETGARLRRLDARNQVGAIAFAPDGRVLASTSLDGLRIWSVLNGQLMSTYTLSENWLPICAFSPHPGRLAFTEGPRKVAVWNVPGNRCVKWIPDLTDTVRSCAFSPDGKVFATTGDRGAIRLWQIESGELCGTLNGHRGGVTSCAFSPDGLFLLSAGLDGTVRLWETRSRGLRWVLHHLPDEQFAIVAPRPTRDQGDAARVDYHLLGATPDAWRWLGWVTREPQTGMPVRLPAESFGTLPALRVQGSPAPEAASRPTLVRKAGV